LWKASNCLYNFSSSLKLRYKNVWLPRPLKESLTKTSISLELAAHSLFEIVKFGLFEEEGNFTYIVLKLQSDYNLAYNGMIFLLCLFSLFVVYSVFSISVSKRTSEYGILQTLGISEAADWWHLTFGTLDVIFHWISVRMSFRKWCFKPYVSEILYFSSFYKRSISTHHSFQRIFPHGTNHEKGNEC